MSAKRCHVDLDGARAVMKIKGLMAKKKRIDVHLSKKSIVKKLAKELRKRFRVSAGTTNITGADDAVLLAVIAAVAATVRTNGTLTFLTIVIVFAIRQNHKIDLDWDGQEEHLTIKLDPK